MAKILQNQEAYFDGRIAGSTGMLQEEQGGIASTNSVGSNDSNQGFSRYKKIIIPLVRRVFPELITNQIVGVQPMMGPVGLAYAMRFRYLTTKGTISQGDEAGYNTIDSTYSANATAGRPYSTTEGERLDSSNFLGAPSGNRAEIGLTVERKEITAHGRYLKAEWSIEAQQDLMAMQGVDVESETTDMLAYQISAEIDREVIEAITALAKQGGVFNWNYATSGDGRWEQEKLRTLYSLILKAGEDIAKATRRGAGNYLICSPNVVAALTGMTDIFKPAYGNNSVNSNTFGASYVGDLGVYKVYRDFFATTDFIVVGYKGPKDSDSGLIFNPYVPIMFAKTQGEEDFHPRLGVMTRYAICDHLFGAENYYRYISVNLGNRTFAQTSTTSGSYTSPYTS